MNIKKENSPALILSSAKQIVNGLVMSDINVQNAGGLECFAITVNLIITLEDGKNATTPGQRRGGDMKVYRKIIKIEAKHIGDRPTFFIAPHHVLECGHAVIIREPKSRAEAISFLSRKKRYCRKCSNAIVS